MTNNMNNKRVAIEANLSNVREYLSQQGYQCEELNAQNASAQGYSAVVISGADQNIMGMANAQTNAQVINAHGMTPQEVAKRIQQS
jgi:predicted Rossmann-fold nucleotide-binding protein